MDNCICGSCKNLKPVQGDGGEITEYVCEFGWPDQSCDECSGEECNAVCANFISDGDDTETVICHCTACGKELRMITGDQSEGKIFCLDCYLKNNM